MEGQSNPGPNGKGRSWLSARTIEKQYGIPVVTTGRWRIHGCPYLPGGRKPRVKRKPVLLCQGKPGVTVRRWVWVFDPREIEAIHQARCGSDRQGCDAFLTEEETREQFRIPPGCLWSSLAGCPWLPGGRALQSRIELRPRGKRMLHRRVFARADLEIIAQQRRSGMQTEWRDEDGTWLTAARVKELHAIDEGSLARWRKHGCPYLEGQRRPRSKRVRLTRRGGTPAGHHRLVWVYHDQDIGTIVRARSGGPGDSLPGSSSGRREWLTSERCKERGISCQCLYRYLGRAHPLLGRKIESKRVLLPCGKRMIRRRLFSAEDVDRLAAAKRFGVAPYRDPQDRGIEEFDDSRGHWTWIPTAAGRAGVAPWVLWNLIWCEHEELGGKQPRTCTRIGKQTKYVSYHRTYVLQADFDAIGGYLKDRVRKERNPRRRLSDEIVVPGAADAGNGQPETPAWKAEAQTILSANPTVTLTYLELAKLRGLTERREVRALRARLSRWQQKHRTAAEEIADPKPHQPKYRYPLGQVVDLL